MHSVFNGWCKEGRRMEERRRGSLAAGWRRGLNAYLVGSRKSGNFWRLQAPCSFP
ncbi:MAG: hypothetical protein ACKERG_00610 [Candidatus Hodgkinia cicadicola]